MIDLKGSEIEVFHSLIYLESSSVIFDRFETTHKVNSIISQPGNLQALIDPPLTAQEISPSLIGQAKNQPVKKNRQSSLKIRNIRVRFYEHQNQSVILVFRAISFDEGYLN